jgi:hypothetical protein
MSEDRTLTISKHEVVLDRGIMEEIWEVAFDADAFEKGFTDEEVYHKLKEFSEKALAWDTMYQEAQPDDNEDTQENYDLREKMETYLGSCK